jgi:hypothetical protein
MPGIKPGMTELNFRGRDSVWKWRRYRAAAFIGRLERVASLSICA